MKNIFIGLFLIYCINAFAGSSQCAYGTNGSVSCGGESSQCAFGSNGSVSCGGKSSQCSFGANGSVSCGRVGD